MFEPTFTLCINSHFSIQKFANIENDKINFE